jgi:hypothetical protein
MLLSPYGLCFSGKESTTTIGSSHTNAAYEEQNWLADSGANTLITHDLENLQVQQPFQQVDDVTVGNGSAYSNTGSSLLHTPNSSFKLTSILHFPKASANLLSIHRFCLDNACYFVLTSFHYFVKDLLTHKVLLEGKSENGLYPLQFGSSLHKGNKTFAALIGIRTTSLV